MSELAKILIVDDTEVNLEVLMALLGDHYDLLVATEGESALAIATEEQLDLILLDIMMPHLDGFEVCRRLKQNPLNHATPIIFITSRTDEESIEHAYDVGGVDYITKPFRHKEIHSRIATHLALAGQQRLLEQEVARQTRELQLLNEELNTTQQEIIFTMGVIGERRSEETGQHVVRVAEYSYRLAKAAGLTEEFAGQIRQASPMHDIGKVAIPDAILNKPARLTAEEFAIIQQHSEYGYELLKHAQRPLLRLAATIAYTHHERWDGCGYPRQLAGEAIPLVGRISAIADVFDALISPRVYKPALAQDEVIAILRDGRGRHFDPQLLDLFLAEVIDS